MAAKKKAQQAPVDVAARLAGRDVAEANTLPDEPVEVTIATALQLAQLAAPELGRIAGLPDMDAGAVSELAAYALHLSECEVAWQRARARPPTRAAETQAALRLRRDLMASARFLLRKDPVLQQVLDEIRGGNGIADLAMDLHQLAHLVDQHPRVFALDPALPEDVSHRAHLLAQRLLIGTDPTAATGSQMARNAAYWLVRATAAETRAALRFLWRKQPEKLALVGAGHAAKWQKDAQRRRKAALKAAAPPKTPSK